MTNCDFGKIIEKSLNGDNPFFENQLNQTGKDLLIRITMNLTA